MLNFEIDSRVRLHNLDEIASWPGVFELMDGISHPEWAFFIPGKMKKFFVDELEYLVVDVFGSGIRLALAGPGNDDIASDVSNWMFEPCWIKQDASEAAQPGEPVAITQAIADLEETRTAFGEQIQGFVNTLDKLGYNGKTGHFYDIGVKAYATKKGLADVFGSWDISAELNVNMDMFFSDYPHLERIWQEIFYAVYHRDINGMDKKDEDLFRSVAAQRYGKEFLQAVLENRLPSGAKLSRKIMTVLPDESVQNLVSWSNVFKAYQCFGIPEPRSNMLKLKKFLTDFYTFVSSMKKMSIHFTMDPTKMVEACNSRYYQSCYSMHHTYDVSLFTMLTSPDVGMIYIPGSKCMRGRVWVIFDKYRKSFALKKTYGFMHEQAIDLICQKIIDALNCGPFHRAMDETSIVTAHTNEFVGYLDKHMRVYYLKGVKRLSYRLSKPTCPECGETHTNSHYRCSGCDVYEDYD